MINVTDLATQWGKVFGGINEINTFRGTTMYTRVDTIAALYESAAEQRLAAEGLYNQALSIDSGFNPAVSFFMTMSKETLKVAAVEDSNYPIATDDETLYKKLVSDALGTAETFQRPTVSFNGGTGLQSFSIVTTLQGNPYGTGTIVGTPIDPATGLIRNFIYPEVIRAVCTVDSYNGGATAGQESFQVQGYAAVDTLNAEWPKGSGVNTTIQAFPTTTGTLISNPYFDTWDSVNVNQPGSWELGGGLIAGTNVAQSSDAYIAPYSMRITAAPLNSYFRQQIIGLTGPQNYALTFRVKHVTAIISGVITYALRDAAGTILTDALGNNISGTVSLVGGAGTWAMSRLLVSVPRAFPTTVYLTFTFTTAMAVAETVGIDTVEFIPMLSLYSGGPDIAFIRGDLSWAQNDTLEATVLNNATTASFIRVIDRLYGQYAKVTPPPTAAVPTISDALIS